MQLTSAYIVYTLNNKGNITLCLVLNKTFMNFARLMFKYFLLWLWYCLYKNKVKQIRKLYGIENGLDWEEKS